MITLSDLLTATGGQLSGPALATTWVDFCHDSRLAEPGQLFVALRTATGDGHDHIAEAVARGCTGVLCQQAGPEPPTVTTLLAPDTGDALRAWAAHILRQYRPVVIAITGSSGKTTAKDLTAAMLERAFPGQVFRTQESYNDRLGIPLALGRLQAGHRFAVIEVGTDAYGEIAALAALIQPDVAAITVINDAHIGTFGSQEAIAAEKLALVHGLRENGVAVLNADDPWQRSPGARDDVTLYWHGATAPACLRLTPAGAPALAGVDLALEVDPPLVPAPFTGRLRSQLIGEHQLAALRTAMAIAFHLGVSPADVVTTVAEFRPLPGRLRPLPGCQDATLLDDSYSANPAATLAALQTLAALPGQHVVILGEHSGLGAQAEGLLADLGPALASTADHLVVVGPQAQTLATAAQSAGLPRECIHTADTPAAAAALARTLLATGAICLVKGSREARMERTVAALLAQPATAAAELVRQNTAWQRLRLRNTLRPTWVEIDTLALADNVRAARRRLHPGVKLIGVLKADGYGHGAPTVARVALQAGADGFAVACLPEALALRRAGIAAPILILGYTPPWQARSAVELDLQLTVYDADGAAALDQAAAALGRTVPVHVKVDTGMGRLGLFPDDIPDFLRYLHTLRDVQVLGLFTHMAIADVPGHEHTDLQLRRFETLLGVLDGLGLRPPLVHAANTATFLTRPDAHYDAIRLGIGMYGLAPSPELPLPPDFRPVLSWKTTVAQVKTLPPGSTVGYGLTYRTAAEQTIAIIPVGYADGFRRAPQHWQHVLVRGREAPLVGRVSMDQTAIDVTGIPGVRPGDEVVLIGHQGDAQLTADQVAAHLGTIGYEVVSAILARVPRLAA